MIQLTKHEAYKYFHNDIKDDEVLFKMQKFLPDIKMSKEDIIKQVTILKMKENYKHDSEAFNLINDTVWDGKIDDGTKLRLKDPTSKIKAKMLKSLK